MDETLCMSCIDCGAKECNRDFGEPHYPDFCLTAHMDEGVLADAMREYEDEDNRRMAIAAAEVEFEHYCEFTRVQEIMCFAKKIGAKKLGIATCVGLLHESRILARILRHHGFEVYGVACKCGAQDKTSVGISQECQDFSRHMCNPILQAKLLHEAKTELNIVMGLCVGHDSLFYKYADAPVTTCVTKDRVLAHNPAAALYGADFYFKKKLFDTPID